ncbi:MAG: prepilin-type N-terminal cleavage/methylation domain-containing protein [Armatimonadetes bacterium]|nr:prepilin-type N-terminal cleavage/methylation domain-containing protein [Akkermansiaceae bacterium]
MKIAYSKSRRGFTLIELTVAIMVGMAIGATVLAMMNQQIAFLKIFRAQSFLNEEAPMISNHVTKLLSSADRFRLHASVADALAGTNPRLTDSPVVVLNYRQPDGVVRAGILSFENRGQGNALYYYVVPTSGLLGTPQWSVTNKPANVSFFMTAGVIRTRLTGPAGEEIIFSGAMQ